MSKVLSSVRLAMLLLAAYVLTGCASITGTTNQSVSVQTREMSGKEVAGAACELTNSKGTWFVTTPGSVSIHRSNDDMQATCRKDGFDPGRAAIVSETKGSMFGNIIFGGGVGALIDHNNGSAYEYPTLIQIVMGNFTKIEPPKAPGDSTGQSASTTSIATQTAVSQPPPNTSAPALTPSTVATPNDQPAVSQSITPNTSQPVMLAPQQAKASAQQTAPVLLAPQSSQTQQHIPAQNAQPAAPSTVKSREARLVELKRLYDQGLVSKEAYLEQQKRILDSTL